jgi:phospholipase C
MEGNRMNCHNIIKAAAGSAFCLATLTFPAPTHAAMPPGITHVFTIVMENHDWSSIKGSSSAPYINSLLTRPDASYASNYHNINPSLGSLHPSEPNYIWLEAGTNQFSDHTFNSDQVASAANSTTSTNHLTTLLQNKGLTWKSYQENMPGSACPLRVWNNYAPKHNPMVFFQDVTGNNNLGSSNCIAHIRPFTDLGCDLANNAVGNYNFITPNLDDDMHDGSISQADTWLKNNLPAILNSPSYKNGGAVFITWDEGGSGNKPIGMIMLSSKAKGHGYTNSNLYDHSSYVKTIEQIFGLSPLLGHAADPSTQSLEAFFIGGSNPTTPTPQPSHTPSPTPTAKPTATPTGKASSSDNNGTVLGTSSTPSPTPTESHPSQLPETGPGATVAFAFLTAVAALIGKKHVLFHK